MNQLHRLKVKVTLQSHGIYATIRVCSISPEPISLNFTQMFRSEVVCRTNYSAILIQGLGHNSRSRNLLLNFVSFKSPQPFVRFSLNITKMFLLVSQCAEPMTRLCKGLGDSAAGDMPGLQTALLLNLGQMLISVRR